jgi:hypothetical protein
MKIFPEFEERTTVMENKIYVYFESWVKVNRSKNYFVKVTDEHVITVGEMNPSYYLSSHTAMIKRFIDYCYRTKYLWSEPDKKQIELGIEQQRLKVTKDHMSFKDRFLMKFHMV